MTGSGSALPARRSGQSLCCIERHRAFRPIDGSMNYKLSSIIHVGKRIQPTPFQSRGPDS